MREFIETFDPFKKGLNPFNTVDNAFFKDGYGVRITESGIEYLDILSLLTAEYLDTFNIGINKKFPQIFKLGGVKYLLSETRFFTLSGTDTLTEIALTDYKTETKATAVGDGRWHFSNIADFYYFTNGTSQIFKKASTWYVHNGIKIGTVEEFKGHIVTANFNNTYYNAEWKTFFDSMGNVTYSPEMAVSGSTIIWSSVNAGDLLWVYNPSEAFEGVFNEEVDYEFYKSWMFRGDSGSIDFADIGEIKALKKSGDYLFAYGTTGSLILGFAIDPVPTLSVVARLDFGLQNREAIDGDSNTHFIISDRNNLYKIGNGKIEKIGFNHKLSSENFSLVYNKVNDEVYINGFFSSFLFNSGLSNLKDPITTLTNI